jgi:hypothetical protein
MLDGQFNRESSGNLLFSLSYWYKFTFYCACNRKNSTEKASYFRVFATIFGGLDR